MKKILLTLALVAAAQFTFAQEKTDDAKQPASELMTQLRLASDLARYGYETYSASALIEAARILNGVPTYELTPESFIKGEGTADGKAQKTEFSVEQLLKDARAYADGKKHDDYTDTCYCSWTPKWTGAFTIKIKNRGGVCNYYTLYTN